MIVTCISSHNNPIGASQVYPDRIEALVKEISGMTLLEVAELNECLKKRLNIADAPMMMAGPAAAPAAAVEVRTGEIES